MPPTETQVEQFLPPWLAAAVLICLPATAVAVWRIGRWYVSARPIPLPADRAMPAVRWPVWFGLGLFVLMFLGMGLSAWCYASLKHAGLLPWEPVRLPSMFSPGIFIAQVLPPIIGLAAVRLFGRGAAACIGVRVGRTGPTILAGIAAFAAVLPVCLAGLWVNTQLAGALGVPPEKHPLLVTVEESHGLWVIALAVFQAGVLASLAEEFIYRGVLMMTLIKEIGVAGALVLSSAVFALVHLPSEPQAILPLFFLGIAMGYVAYWTRSLLASVVTHSLFNCLMLVGVFVGTR